MADYISNYTGSEIDTGVNVALSLSPLVSQVEAGKALSSNDYTTAEKEKLSNLSNFRPNLLDNWYFGNPVNQQRVTSWTSGYGIDRWKINDGAGTISIIDNGLSIAHSGNFVALAQFFENYTMLVGKTITVSALHPNGNLMSRTVTITNSNFDIVLFDSADGNGYFNIIGTESFACLRLFNNDATPMNVTAVKVEFGDTQTLAHQDSNGNWVLNEIPKYEEELLKCRQYDSSTGEYIGLRKFSQPRNLLDNSDFSNPVNQRGETAYSGISFTIDRWQIFNSTLTIGDGYINSPEFYQFLELPLDKVFTLAACADDGSVAVVSGIPLNPAEATKDGVTVILTNISGYVEPIIRSEKNLIWAALYEGYYTEDTLPEYQPKGYGAELAECKRYYQRSYETTPQTEMTNGTMFYHCAASKYGGGTHFFPVEMRVTPTVTTYSPGSGTAGKAEEWVSGDDVTVNISATPKGFQLRSSAGALTANAFYVCHYEASADL